MQTERLFILEWSIIDKISHEEVKRGRGVYCGVNLTDAQRDAVEDTEEFDDLTQVMVFDKNFIELNV